MVMYFNMISGLSSMMFFISIGGLIYSLIRKKPKKLWLLGLVMSFAIIILVVSLSSKIINRLDFYQPKVSDTSNDPDGTVILETGKYIIGEEELSQGIYDLEIGDSGSFEVVSMVPIRNFSDYKAFNDLEKSRIYLNDGDGLEINDKTIVKLVPAQIEKKNYEEVEIYSGMWIVGDTLAPGKYRLKDVEHPGNINIYRSKEGEEVNEIVEEDIAIEVFEEDLIIIKGTKFKLVPAS